MRRQALLVLGMHRSGTSALAGLLVRLGVQAPRTLVVPDDRNPLGYWESQSFVDFHERLLWSAGTSWDMWTAISPQWFDSSGASSFALEFGAILDSEFDQASLFVVKDPRICRLVPFWLRNLQVARIDPVAVLILRSPSEVAASLQVRGDLANLEQARLLWLRHVLEAEHQTRAIKRSIVRYSDLLDDWKREITRISDDTDLRWPAPSELADTVLEAAVRPDLRHHAAVDERSGIESPIREWVACALEGFALLLTRDPSRRSEAFEMLDGVRRELDQAAAQFARALEINLHEVRDELITLQDRTFELERQCEALRGDLAGARHHVDALLGSASWRITGPLRAAYRLLPQFIKPKISPSSPDPDT